MTSPTNPYKNSISTEEDNNTENSAPEKKSVYFLYLFDIPKKLLDDVDFTDIVSLK